MTRTYDFDPLRKHNNWELTEKNKLLDRKNQFLKMNDKQLDAIRAHFESQHEGCENEKMKVSIRKISLKEREINPTKFDKACCCCCCTACCSSSKN